MSDQALTEESFGLMGDEAQRPAAQQQLKLGSVALCLVVLGYKDHQSTIIYYVAYIGTCDQPLFCSNIKETIFFLLHIFIAGIGRRLFTNKNVGKMKQTVKHFSRSYCCCSR